MPNAGSTIRHWSELAQGYGQGMRNFLTPGTGMDGQPVSRANDDPVFGADEMSARPRVPTADWARDQAVGAGDARTAQLARPELRPTPKRSYGGGMY